MDQYKTAGPGPAAYLSRTERFTRGGKFGRAKRRGLEFYSAAPGPGQYPAKSFIGKDGPKPLVLSRRPDTSPKYGDHSPGPGTYKLMSRSMINGFTMGKSKRQETFGSNNVPGPLAYTPSDLSKRKSSPRWSYFYYFFKQFSMGKGKRPPLLPPKDGPGPCTYVVPSNIGKEGFKPILHGKHPPEKPDEIPGPGSYDPNYKVMLEKFPAIALSTGPRVEKDFSTKKDIPGPGTYSMNSTLNGPKFGFGVSGKSSPKPDKEIPGPGAYKVPCTFAKTASYLIPNKTDTFKFV